MDKKPSIFIGSSTPGLPVAEALVANLDAHYDAHLWNQDVFGVAQITIEALVNAGSNYDFAILVFSADDKLEYDGRQWLAPRDNVVLEFGFFLGTIGRKRTFIVHEKNPLLKLPSDINGVTTAIYIGPSENIAISSVGAASIKIKAAMKLELDNQRSLQLQKDRERRRKIQQLVRGSLQVVCRALASTSSPEDVGLRAFIFQKIGNDLVFLDYWSPLPAGEASGVRFGLNEESEKDVAVVVAARQMKVCGMTITTPPGELKDADGDIDKDLRYVLASPIVSPDGELLGTVDFDASSLEGEEILRHKISHNVIYELGHLLHLAFN